MKRLIDQKEIQKFVIEGNHDFSIIIPLPGRLDVDLFEACLETNLQHYQKNGMELILVVCDHDTEIRLLQTVKQLRFTNWKMVSCLGETSHAITARLVQVGLIHATRKYCVIIASSDEFRPDCLYELRSALEQHSGEYVRCEVVPSSGSGDHPGMFAEAKDSIGECIAFGREELTAACACGVSESKDRGPTQSMRSILDGLGFRGWTPKGVLMERRAPLECLQANHLYVGGNSIHADLGTPGEVQAIGIERSMQETGPSSCLVTDSRDSTLLAHSCKDYLSQFEHCDIVDNEVSRKRFEVVALVQAYNETESLCSFMQHVEHYCDGIVFLDDGSTDASYDLAKSDKLIMKARKSRLMFDDLENRNILLRLASFVDAGWLYFIDVDERFDERYDNLRSAIRQKDTETVTFKLVNLWGDHRHYRRDYPHSIEGVRTVFRMFKNIGHMQIHSSKKLHFLPIPHLGKVINGRVLVKHYGMLTKEKRHAKYTFYSNQDQRGDQLSYEHLLDENVELASVDEISAVMVSA